jgi:GT2 family glycosyltransferase
MNVDIIIPGYGNLPLLRRCLRSLEQHSPAANVIYVDNGTAVEPLARLLEDYPTLTLLHVPRPCGFVRAVNLGMAASFMQPAPFLVWLNNDTEVTAGWLDALLSPFADADVGAVGAVSNNVYGFQRREAPGTQLLEAPLLIGFAVAFRKQAAAKVGFLDERFSPGNYEDWDYSFRLRAAGWRLLVQERAWVEHKMHQTFRQDLNALLSANLQKLVEKWGVDGLREMGVELQVEEAEREPA